MACKIRIKSKLNQGDFVVATWNIQGGFETKQDYETVENDMVKYKIDNRGHKIEFRLKEKILKRLIEDKSPQTILQISKALNTDYKNTFQAVNKAYPDLIFKDKKGSRLYKIYSLSLHLPYKII